MEAIMYACQSHEQRLPNGWRRGFLIGDGTGVGKGRTIAGIIVHNYELKRKRSVWLIVSSDLRFDTQRDLEDVAGKNYCLFYVLSKFKYGSIKKQDEKSNKGIMFATYASLVGKSKAGGIRLQQLIEWFGEKYDGCIIFDECHRAKNLCPKSGTTGSSLIGKCFVDLQRTLPNARIVYASATGATEPRNMAYMEQFGLWVAGTVFHGFAAIKLQQSKEKMNEFLLKVVPNATIIFRSVDLGKDNVYASMVIKNETQQRFAVKLDTRSPKTFKVDRMYRIIEPGMEKKVSFTFYGRYVPADGDFNVYVYSVAVKPELKSATCFWKDYSGPTSSKTMKVVFKKEDEKKDDDKKESKKEDDKKDDEKKKEEGKEKKDEENKE